MTNNGTGTGQCGPGASTTGNIYGVYDMIGGAYDRVMGNLNNDSESSGFASSWFTTTSNIKYYNKFTTTTPSTTKSKETMGQAYVETAGWYSDYEGSLSASSPWVIRGGYYNVGTIAGAFISYGTPGSYDSGTSFRSVLATIVR